MSTVAVQNFFPRYSPSKPPHPPGRRYQSAPDLSLYGYLESEVHFNLHKKQSGLAGIGESQSDLGVSYGGHAGFARHEILDRHGGQDVELEGQDRNGVDVGRIENVVEEDRVHKAHILISKPLALITRHSGRKSRSR